MSITLSAWLLIPGIQLVAAVVLFVHGERERWRPGYGERYTDLAIGLLIGTLCSLLTGWLA